MNRSHPRWLLPFVFAGAAIGRAPDVVEPLFSPAVAAVLVGAVTFVGLAAVIVATLAIAPPSIERRAPQRHQDPTPARRRANPKRGIRHDKTPFLTVAAMAAAITFASLAPSIGWIATAWADQPRHLDERPSPTPREIHDSRVAAMLESLPPEVALPPGFGFALAMESPPIPTIVDWNIDGDGCWVVELVNDRLGDPDAYPFYVIGTAREYAQFLDLMDPEAAQGPNALNQCMLDAQAHCSYVCWAMLWGPNGDCIWNCGPPPCPAKPVYLSYWNIVEMYTD